MNSDLHRIQSIFVNMQENGWDTNQPLKWGYFFVDEKRSLLIQLSKELQKQLYNEEYLQQEDAGIWILNVSKVEVLTAEELHNKNELFNKLAKSMGAELYDGWDVEKP